MIIQIHWKGAGFRKKTNLYCLRQVHPKNGLENTAFDCKKKVHLKNLPQAMSIQVADFAIIHPIHQHCGSPRLYTYSQCHQMLLPWVTDLSTHVPPRAVQEEGHRALRVYYCDAEQRHAAEHGWGPPEHGTHAPSVPVNCHQSRAGSCTPCTAQWPCAFPTASRRPNCPYTEQPQSHVWWGCGRRVAPPPCPHASTALSKHGDHLVGPVGAASPRLDNLWSRLHCVC